MDFPQTDMLTQIWRIVIARAKPEAIQIDTYNGLLRFAYNDEYRARSAHVFIAVGASPREQKQGARRRVAVPPLYRVKQIMLIVSDFKFI